MLHLKDEIATALALRSFSAAWRLPAPLLPIPKLLLLDEPAAGMNPQETLELAQFIREIREKHHLTVFLIEHHMELVMQISDYIYVIDFGSEHSLQGTPKEVQNNQRVIDAYLGVVEDDAETILKINDLKVNYGGIEAVKGISFGCSGRAASVTLIGANGAGKSLQLCVP